MTTSWTPPVSRFLCPSVVRAAPWKRERRTVVIRLQMCFMTYQVKNGYIMWRTKRTGTKKYFIFFHFIFLGMFLNMKSYVKETVIPLSKILISEEECDLSPRRVCKPMTKMVPSLKPSKQCTMVGGLGYWVTRGANNI